MKKIMKKYGGYGVLFCVLMAMSLLFLQYMSKKTLPTTPFTPQKTSTQTENVSPVSIKDTDLQVHFIDVGQADCILLIQRGHAMLIDGGNTDDGELIVSYLKEQGVTTLDLVIATHPHEDHIGGLSLVLQSFPVAKMWMPNKTHTTASFEKLLLTMKKQSIKKTIPNVSEVYELGDVRIEMVSRDIQDEGDSLNNASIVTKVTYGRNRFLFMGDAQKEVEENLMARQLDLGVDVLKIGHHGSKTSTSQQFLAYVSPQSCVISVGKNNEYSLPRKEVMRRLQQMKIPVYRTDESGSIVAISDGTTITFDKKMGSYQYMK